MNFVQSLFDLSSLNPYYFGPEPELPSVTEEVTKFMEDNASQIITTTGAALSLYYSPRLFLTGTAIGFFGGKVLEKGKQLLHEKIIAPMVNTSTLSALSKKTSGTSSVVLSPVKEILDEASKTTNASTTLVGGLTAAIHNGTKATVNAGYASSTIINSLPLLSGMVVGNKLQNTKLLGSK